VVVGGGRGQASRYVVPFDAEGGRNSVTGDTVSRPERVTSRASAVENSDIQGPERVTSRASAVENSDIQGCAFKGVEPLEIQIDGIEGEVVPRELAVFDAELRECPGYDPDERFYRKVIENYGGVLDLEEMGIRIRGWFGEARNRKKRECSRGFVLGWLRREKDRLEGRSERRVEVRKPHVVGGGLDRFR